MRHEVHLTKAALAAALPAAALFCVVGLVAGGPAGAASAALGAGLVVANFAVAAASTGWSRTLTPGVVAIGYLGFVVRMFVMVAAFAVVATRSWVHPAVLAAGFCGVLVAALAGACVGYARGSYVPSWRVR